MTSLSIVIPTLGGGESLRAVLRGLKRLRPRPEGIQVLVVLDAAAPAGLELDADGLPMTVLRASRPGASAARNTGWQATEAPIVLFLDDDVVPTPGLAARHLEDHRRMPTPEVGVLGRVRWSPQVRVTPFMRWLERGVAFAFDEIQGTTAGWGHFYSANASVKRAMLERVGGFDEVAFPYGYEDLELSRRMAALGFRLHYDRQAVGEHLKTETLERWRRNLRRIAVAEHRFVQRYPEVRPYFYERFRAAAEAPPAHGRSARLASFVRPGMPLLGPVVWRSYDAVCSQQLADEFLHEWQLAEREDAHARMRPTAERSPR